MFNRDGSLKRASQPLDESNNNDGDSDSNSDAGYLRVSDASGGAVRGHENPRYNAGGSADAAVSNYEPLDGFGGADAPTVDNYSHLGAQPHAEEESTYNSLVRDPPPQQENAYNSLHEPREPATAAHENKKTTLRRKEGTRAPQQENAYNSLHEPREPATATHENKKTTLRTKAGTRARVAVEGETMSVYNTLVRETPSRGSNAEESNDTRRNTAFEKPTAGKPKTSAFHSHVPARKKQGRKKAGQGANTKPTPSQARHAHRGGNAVASPDAPLPPLPAKPTQGQLVYTDDFDFAATNKQSQQQTSDQSETSGQKVQYTTMELPG